MVVALLAAPRARFGVLCLSALSFLAPLLAESATPERRDWSRAHPAAVLQPDDDMLLDEIQRTALRFFMEQSHPRTGLVRDRAKADGLPDKGKASIAASGFGLSAWAVGANRGYIDRETALERSRTLLRFVAKEAPRHKGFFYHFMEMDTGARAWQCELSSIDTALFFAGAIVAREYFQDPEISEIVNRLYAEVDWQWFLNGGDTVAMGWHDETGFSRFRWSKYCELMLLSILGIGAEQNGFPAEHWHAWSRRPTGTYAGYHFLQGPPLFVHQFAHAFIDFRGQRDAYADYYRNSVLATLAQRQFSIDLRSEFPSWSERLWGVTASDSANGYRAWGGPPRTTDFNRLDGTIVPCAAAGSVPFAPYEAMGTLRHMRTAYGKQIWRRYGFVDAFNPETGWVNPDVIGIDQGISLLMAENARSGFVWAAFMQAPEIERAMQKAGFVTKERSLPWSDRDLVRDLASQAWNSLSADESDVEVMGLRLSAVLAAKAVGLVPGERALAEARRMLTPGRTPQTAVGLSQYAASLVTLRQAIPALGGEASRRFEALDLRSIKLDTFLLGSANRLAVFLQIASGVRPPSAWAHLGRRAEKANRVYVLAPSQSVSDQFVPGLWLDEGGIVTGASASQVAYNLATEKRNVSDPTYDFNVIETALLLEHLPVEALRVLRESPPNAEWLLSASEHDRLVLLLSAANLLAPDCLRAWFQQDPLVSNGRGLISEFGEAAFGQNSSLFWRNELAGPFTPPPERRALARRSGTPREQWDWQEVSGDAFLDSVADRRDGDPALRLRFAFTWDEKALQIHAEVMDTPAGFTPLKGKRVVEVFIDPHNDGLEWGNIDDCQFAFKASGEREELFGNRESTAVVKTTADGYEVSAEIQWTSLALDPQAGLELAVSPAVVAEGKTETEPALKLNWRFYQRLDDKIGLGVLKLAP